MGSVRFGAPRDLIRWMKDAFVVETFVETGTNHAETAVWAAGVFPNVITVEGQKTLYDENVARHGHHKNISFLLGDTRQHIGTLAKSLNHPAIFWLDAHWCGGETFGVSSECPVLEEIEALNNSTIPHFILIDDARLFTAPPPPPHAANQWPDISTICKLLGVHNSNRYVAIMEDVIVAVPNSSKHQFVEYLRRPVAQESVPAPVDRRSKLRRGLGRIKRALS
ncbi:MAG TPA: hypothetical protein VHS31_16700 [Tepidisphaeraceae bacterium]|jgi:hypothetical protein|nr:hypothetical protein [Tepidisphaeraceae bacterium]